MQMANAKWKMNIKKSGIIFSLMLLRPRLSSARWGRGTRAGLGTSCRSLSSRYRTRR